jgi:hypothetical protein
MFVDMKQTKVAFVGQPEYNLPLYENDLDDIYTIQNFCTLFDLKINRLSVESMSSLIAFRPDISICFRPEYFSKELVSALSGIKVGISTEPVPKYANGELHYSLDSISRFRNLLRAAPLGFDFIFHYDSSSISFMALMGINLSGTVPLPVATRTWTAMPGAERGNNWDVVFLGRSTTYREKHFSPLKRDLRFLHIAHGITGKDMLPYYHASTIGLNIHSEPELMWEPRVQQLMAAGLLVVSEQISPNGILVPGEHFIEITDPSSTYEICERIVANPRQFEGIRRAGYERVRNLLSACQIWPSLISGCLEGAFSRPLFDLERVHLGPLEICAEFSGFEHLLHEFRDALS